MSLCFSSTCLPPISPPDCGTIRRSGGINRLVIAPCNLDFYDIRDIGEWCEYYQAGLIKFTHPVLGEKSEASHFMRQLTSCGPETPIGREVSLDIKDHNADDVFFTDYDFYNEIVEGRFKYKIGYLTCDDRFYGWVPNTLAADDVIENASTGITYWQLHLKYTTFHAIKPVKLPRLVEIICEGCINVPAPPPSCCNRWRPVISAIPAITSTVNANITVNFATCSDAESYVIEYISSSNGSQVFTTSSVPYVISGVSQGDDFAINVIAICQNGLEQGPFGTFGKVPSWPCCAPLNGPGNFRLINVVDTGDPGATAFDITAELDMPATNCAEIDSIVLEYNIANGGWITLGTFVATPIVMTMNFFLPIGIAGNPVRFRYRSLCTIGTESARVEWGGTFTGPACCKNHAFNLMQTSVVDPMDSMLVNTTLTWSQCADATEYVLSYGPVGGPYVDETITAPAGTAIISLAASTSSEVRIYAECASGRATPTTTITFTTPGLVCCPPTSITWDYGNITDNGVNYIIPYTLVRQEGGNCTPTGHDYPIEWRRVGDILWTSSGSLTDETGNFTGIPLSEAGYPLQVRIQGECGGADYLNTTLQLTCCEPTNVTGTLINVSGPNANIRVDWNECFIAGVVQVEYRLNGAGAWTSTPGSPFAGPPANITIPILVGTTSIDIRVRTQCGPSSFSGWVTPTINIPIPLPCCSPSAFNVDFAAASIVMGPGYDVPYTYTLQNTPSCTVSTAAEYRWRVAAGVWSAWIALPMASGNLNISETAVGQNLELELRATCGGGVVSLPITRTGIICCPPTNLVFSVESINANTAFVDIMWTACTAGPVQVEYQLSGAGSWLPVSGSPFNTNVVENTPIPISGSVTSINIRIRTVCGGVQSVWNTGTPEVLPVPPTCCPPESVTIGTISVVPPNYVIPFTVNVDPACVSGITGYTAQYATNSNGPWTNIPGVILGTNELLLASSIPCGTTIYIRNNHTCVNGQVFAPVVTSFVLPAETACVITFGDPIFIDTSLLDNYTFINIPTVNCGTGFSYEYEYSYFNKNTGLWDSWKTSGLSVTPGQISISIPQTIYQDHNQILCSIFSKARIRVRTKCNTPNSVWSDWSIEEIDLGKCYLPNRFVSGGIPDRLIVQTVCVNNELITRITGSIPFNEYPTRTTPCAITPDVSFIIYTDLNPTGISLPSTILNSHYPVNAEASGTIGGVVYPAGVYTTGYIQDLRWELTHAQFMQLFGDGPCPATINSRTVFSCGTESAILNTSQPITSIVGVNILKQVDVVDNGSDCNNIRIRVDIERFCNIGTATPYTIQLFVNNQLLQNLFPSINSNETFKEYVIPRPVNLQGAMQLQVGAIIAGQPSCVNVSPVMSSPITIPACEPPPPCCVPTAVIRNPAVESVSDCTNEYIGFLIVEPPSCAGPGLATYTYDVQYVYATGPLAGQIALFLGDYISLTGQYGANRTGTAYDLYIRVRTRCSGVVSNWINGPTVTVKQHRPLIGDSLGTYTSIGTSIPKGSSQAVIQNNFKYTILDQFVNTTHGPAYCGPEFELIIHAIAVGAGGTNVRIGPIPGSGTHVFSNQLIHFPLDPTFDCRIDVSWEATNGIVTILHRIDSPLGVGKEVDIFLNIEYAYDPAKICCLGVKIFQEAGSRTFKLIGF
jgi:hypothetical protein